MKQSVRGRAGTASGLSRKLLALAAAGAVAVVVTTSTDRVAVAQDEARFECPREDVAETGCRGPKDCLYPGLDDLNSYTACTPNPDGVTGTAKTMPCPGDLEWNDDKKECDYPGQGTGALAGLLDTALTADSTMHPDGTVTLHTTLIRADFDIERPLQDRRIRFMAAESPWCEADTDGRASCTAPKPVNELPGTFRAYFDEVANLFGSTDGGLIQQP